MKRMVDSIKLDRLDRLIRQKATGTPDELAKRLEISRRNLSEMIVLLKEEMKAPIIFNHNKQSYVYEYFPNFFWDSTAIVWKKLA